MSLVATIAVPVAALSLGMGAHRVARAMARPFGLGPLGPGAIAVGLATTSFLVATGLVGRAAGRLDPGLVAAAIVGLVLFAVSGRVARWADGLGSASDSAVAEERLSRRERWVLGAVLGLVGVGYAYLAWKYQMHDEHAIFGHKSMLEEMRHGYYPPYLPPEPTLEARYHYGYDVLAGALARAFGFSADVAIDLVCVALALFMSWAAAAVAIDNDARRSAPFAAVAIHLGAGLAAFTLSGVAGRHPRCAVQYHHPTCGMDLFPTQLLNVFQHPVSLGVPLLLVLVLVAPRVMFTKARTRAPLVAAGLVAVLFAGLAIGQFVYFALGGLGLVAALPVWFVRRAMPPRPGRFEARPPRDHRGALRGALLLIAALGLGFFVAWLLGGLLAPADAHQPGLVVRRHVLGFPENKPLYEILRHHVANLGLGFVLLPVLLGAVLASRRPAPVHLLAFAMGGILVPHVYEYTRSWDIVKFPSAASFGLSMLYVVIVDRALAELELPWAWLRRVGQLLLVGTGIAAAVMIIWPLRGDLRLYELGDRTVDPQVKKVIDWLWANGYEKEQLVLSQSNVAPELAVFGGISVIGEDSDLLTQGLKDSFLDEQRRLASTARATLDPQALAKLRAGWLVFSDEEVQNLGAPARLILSSTTSTDLEKVVTFDFPEEPRRRRSVWRVKIPPAPRERR